MKHVSSYTFYLIDRANVSVIERHVLESHDIVRLIVFGIFFCLPKKKVEADYVMESHDRTSRKNYRNSTDFPTTAVWQVYTHTKKITKKIAYTKIHIHIY